LGNDHTSKEYLVLLDMDSLLRYLLDVLVEFMPALFKFEEILINMMYATIRW